jgi:putative DNA primase/helicase
VDAGLAIASRADDLRQVFTEQVTHQQPTELSPFGQAALRLAQRGLLVFPCKARSKHPATKHGLKDAKTDLTAIETTWRKYPDLNVGVATGAVSGVVVLDVDGEIGFDSLSSLEDRNDVLPDTKSLTTPSGGQHFWFKHPGVEIRNTAGFPGPGLDIRGDGGYVLVPPSVGPGGSAYVVDDESPPAHMPAWLVEMLRRYQEKVDQALAGATDWPAFLNEAPSQGERDTRMTKYVGHLFRCGMDSREVYATAGLLNALSKPPMDDKQLTKIVQSIARRSSR